MFNLFTCFTLEISSLILYSVRFLDVLKLRSSSVNVFRRCKFIRHTFKIILLDRNTRDVSFFVIIRLRCFLETMEPAWKIDCR